MQLKEDFLICIMQSIKGSGFTYALLIARVIPL